MANERISVSRSASAPLEAVAKAASPAILSPSGRLKARGKDEPRDVPREICETVVFVVVLVLMLKTFVAEAFVIPTGSMAETLYGYQRMVTCAQCKQVFPVNCSSEIDPQDGNPRPITGCVCPNCQHEMSWGKGTGPDWYTGDRVLVAKFLFDRDLLWRPNRHEVFVFKYPEAPQKGTTAMNYIKRCEGLSEETLAICSGDLYVTKSLKYPRPPADVKATDLWKPQFMHINDDGAVGLLKDSLNRSAEGTPTAGDFEIIRKPPAQILSMRRIVYNNDHQPADLAGKVLRWHHGSSRWTGDDAKMPKVFTHAGSAADAAEAWLSYAHLLRNNHARFRPDQPPGFERDERRLISNMQGYNTGEGDPNRDPYGEHWVGDLLIDCQVKVAKAEGELVFDLAKGVDRFQARFDLSSGVCSLIRLTGTKLEAIERKVLEQKPTKLKGTGSWHVRFADVDERLIVWVDRSLPFGDGVAYTPARKRGPVGENDLEPAKIGVIKGDVAISRLQLWRDSYYTLNVQKSTATIAVGDSSESVQSFYVQPGHYLALGDNSGASADSRYWGLVPERLLLGRALAVYFPFWPFAVQTRLGFIE